MNVEVFGKTLLSVLSSQSKLKLRRKRKNKIEKKIYANLDQITKQCDGH